MHRFRLKPKWFNLLIFSGMFFATVFHAAYASDHLDTPTVIADPAADIGDIFAWTSSDGRRLNLVMGQPALSTVVPCWSAAPATLYAARVPFTLLKNGSSRNPAKTRNRRFLLSMPTVLLASP
jgi:hypothetical protein